MTELQKTIKFPEFFKNFTKQIGFSTSETSKKAKEKKKLLEQTNPDDVFFLDLKIDLPPRIAWTHNTQMVLGCARLDYSNFVQRIHPSYLDIYYQFAAASYLLSLQYKDEIKQLAATYSILVPLKDDKGDYYWFTQKTEMSEFDKNNNLTAHINTYTRITPFEDTLILAKPMVRFEQKRKTDIEKKLGQISGEGILNLLFNMDLNNHLPMRTIHRRILLAWWESYGKIGDKTTHKIVAEHLSDENKIKNKKAITEGTVKKYAQPLLEAANLVFPLHPIKDMNELGLLLVRLFGRRA